MGMNNKDKESLIKIVMNIAEELSVLEAEKERMAVLKEFTTIIQLIRPAVSELVFQEDLTKRAEILRMFKQNLDKVKDKI